MTEKANIREWHSKAELLDFLKSNSIRYIIIGLETEAPRVYYSFSLADMEGSFIIAVLSSGHGTTPDLTVFDNERIAVVAFDSWLTWIDTTVLCVINKIRLNGVFFEFVDAKIQNNVLVVHELGVMRINVNGSVVWSVDTDIIEDYRITSEGNIILAIMDMKEGLVININSGEAKILY